LDVKKCLRCGRKRDLRVEFCAYCGSGSEETHIAKAYAPAGTDVFIDDGFIEPAINLPIMEEQAKIGREQECRLLGIDPASDLDQAQEAEPEDDEDHAAETYVVSLCMRCGLKRDRRLDFCEVCGGGQSTSREVEIPAPRFPPDVYYDVDYPYETGPFAERSLSVSELRNVGAAIRQKIALRKGETLSAEEALRLTDEAHQGPMSPEAAAMVSAFMRTGPGSSGKWEANPFGLSGRVVRGYRHWRHKR
jgi:hypothetical protein